MVARGVARGIDLGASGTEFLPRARVRTIPAPALGGASVNAARASVTPRGLPGPVVVRDRAWLVSDALVVSRLSAHPVLPVRDLALQRGARAVAFALGLLALPDAGPASIAAVDVVLDAEQLGERIALPPSAIGEAFRALWVADVLRHGSAPGMAPGVAAGPARCC